MNVESSQILSGECGIYASIFLIMFAINKPDSMEGYAKLYNSFSFLGDKMMGMYRDLLFWRETNTSARTLGLSNSAIKYWKCLLNDQAIIINNLANEALLEIKGLNNGTEINTTHD